MAGFLMRGRMAGMLGLSSSHVLIFAIVAILLFGGPTDPPNLGWLLERWRK
jgi:Sec-independent protein translocase protein TatA